MYPGILDGDICPHSRLLHSDTVQVPNRTVGSWRHAQLSALFYSEACVVHVAQQLTSIRHALILLVSFCLFLLTQLRLIQLPGSMDRPMAEEAQSKGMVSVGAHSPARPQNSPRKAQGSRSKRMVEEVSDRGLNVTLVDLHHHQFSVSVPPRTNFAILLGHLLLLELSRSGRKAS